MKSKYKKIYVLTPADFATGGIELAHQLVHHLREAGCDCRTVYTDGKTIVKRPSVTKEYAGYNIAMDDTIEDSSENMLVLPEVNFDSFYDFSRINIGFWWMSVDNWFRFCHWSDMWRLKDSLYKRLRAADRARRRGFKNRLRDLMAEPDRTVHFYQSAYAQNFLYNNGVSNVRALSDYINLDFIAQDTDGGSAQRKDVVLYNPAKGYEFTMEIIKANPDLVFLPLKGLTRSQLVELFRTSKLYIDFGHFPGKDRLSREAAANGCCVMTGLNGASFFYEDVPIEAKYKIASKLSNIDRISALMRDIIANYDAHSPHFDYYRRWISREEKVFRTQVEDIFMTTD